MHFRNGVLITQQTLRLAPLMRHEPNGARGRGSRAKRLKLNRRQRRVASWWGGPRVGTSRSQRWCEKWQYVATKTGGHFHGHEIVLSSVDIKPLRPGAATHGEAELGARVAGDGHVIVASLVCAGIDCTS